ncbi:MAG: formamidopyrimidine-DNA glycosylase [bacterium]|nr:MAG: formamidopyrimidine-DNA glycosylase [bacterium]
MPELPEIATMVRAMRPRLVGRTITHVVLEEGGLIDGRSIAAVRSALVGREIVGVVRHGKYVRIDLAGSVGGEWIDLFEPRRRNGQLKKAQKSRPLPSDASMVVRRPETLAEALRVGAEDDWIHGPAMDAIRTAEKRGHSAPSGEADRAGLIEARRRRLGRYEAGERASLVFHLKMTGRYFVMNDNGGALPPRTRLAMTVAGDEDHLVFGLKDVRRLARVQLFTGGAAHEWPAGLCLGPDALTTRWSGVRLQKQVSGALPIKLALLDQSRLAGIGNIYASEVLSLTRINPARRADSLTTPEWNRLAAAIPKLLRHSIRHWCAISRWIGPSVEGYGDFGGKLRVYDRRGEACRRCGGVVRSMVQGARTTFYCPDCQV